MKLRISKNIQKASSTGNRPRFYYITDRRQLSGISLDACIHRAIQWGVDFIQVREKDLPDRLLFEQVKRIVALTHGSKCRILVNGRADIALAAGAHGVHLPSTGLPASAVRSWLPDEFLIGVSVHTEKEIQQAGMQGADYVLLGHVFPTPSKSGIGNPVGLDFLEKMCVQTSIPVFALGGILADRIESVLNAGAIGVAGISIFQKTENFNTLKREYPSFP